MAAFQESKDALECKVILHLMRGVEQDPSISQRALASNLGIAMGLVNAYMKRCIRKGWIRVKQVPARRFAYFLTPAGFAEKSQMTARYLANSLTFFRDARSQCLNLLQHCQEQGWLRIALVGESDLAEIATLVADGVQVVTTVVGLDANFADFDAVIITDVSSPQAVFHALQIQLPEDRLLVPDLLHVSRSVKREETQS